MTASKLAKRPATKAAEPDGKADEAWKAMRWAAEVYWPGLGGKVGQQLEDWNRELFDGKLEPAPIVLDRMSSVHGHWFPLIDKTSDQRIGYEYSLKQAAVSISGYAPPQRLQAIGKGTLLRGMMARFLIQCGQGTSAKDPPWCNLVMDLHKGLTGETIWASPEHEETEPAAELGKGLFRPARKVKVQHPCPKTGRASITQHEISAWPGSVMDLGHITRD